MSDFARIPKAHLTMALCLPLAVIVGYFLVDPLQPSALAFVGFVLAVLTIPLAIKWHHPLLFFCWNSTLAPAIFPGQPYLWTMLAPLALLFGILNRSVDSDRRFIHVPSIRNALLFLLLVVLGTAYVNGGLGFGVFHSSQFGGRRYFYTSMAIIGFFAMTSQKVSIRHAKFYVGLFFLSMLMGIIPNLAFFAGDTTGTIADLVFSPEGSGEQVRAAQLGTDMARVFGLIYLSIGAVCFLIAKYGIRGIFDLSKWWRLVLLLGAFAAGAMSGFRSALILLILIFCVSFILEGLHRTKLALAITGTILLCGCLLVAQAEKLPFFVQRALSFLPIGVSDEVKVNAASSYEWRLDMWKVLVPQIPKYLLKGKGYGIDPTEMYFSTDAHRQVNGGIEWAIIAGDYHSGPLSLIIPLGIWGVIGFTWFVVVSLRYLFQRYRNGDPELRQINTLLLAYFLARLVLFLFIFGSFYSELCLFTGVVGLSVCLNGAEPEPATEPIPAVLEDDIVYLEHRDDPV